MAWRYRKRIKIAPGVYINLSKSGVSTTIGTKGASVNIGKNGTYLNTGIPGTGLYNRRKLSGNNNSYTSTKATNQSTSFEQNGCLWWGGTVLILILICVICSVPLSFGLFLILTIAGLFLSVILAAIFGTKEKPNKLPSISSSVAENQNNESFQSTINSDLWNDKDPLFVEVAQFVVLHQSASTSQIQRQFSIGYDRAGRIIEQLEEAGIIGSFSTRNIAANPWGALEEAGTIGPLSTDTGREVLVDSEGLSHILNNREKSNEMEPSSNTFITEEQFNLIKTETENLCNFLSLITRKTNVRKLCDSVLVFKNEDDSDWKVSDKIRYAMISDIYKCFLGLGHKFESENHENLGLYLFVTKFVSPDTDITFENYSFYKSHLRDSLKGVLDIAKQLVDNSPLPSNQFIIQNILGRYNKDYQLQYMTLLYRFTSAVAKADGKVSEQEAQWLSDIMKSKDDVETNLSSEINQTKELDSDVFPMDELQKLIGLSSVKEEIQRLTNFIKIQQIRKEKGLKESKVSYHCVFTGNPGTGKTTVARIVAGIYKELGIIKKGHLIETDRAGLVAEYVGQTAVKTNKIIDSALDGVLFIDEAYSLIQSTSNDYGHEAISTLLKRMEDERDRLIVILAGYSENMQDFIDSNPGLQSRFNRYIDFQDYTSQQLFDIFMLNVKKHDYTINQKAQEKLKKLFENAIENKDENFGNARYVRNIFEKTLENQAMRLASLTNLSKEILSEINEMDIPIAE